MWAKINFTKEKLMAAVNFMDSAEIWSLHAAVNVKSILPMIETSVDAINIMAMARRIERKYKNPANWNCLVNEQCDPGIKSLLILP
jgi:hypothetical protein